MSILSMKKVEIVALRRDIDRILEILGAESCFQPAALTAKSEADGQVPGEADSLRRTESTKISPLALAVEKVKSARRILDFAVPEFMPEGVHMPSPEDEARLERFWDKVSAFEEESKGNVTSITKTREALEEARAFAGLELPWKSLDDLSFISVRIGHIEPESFGELKSRLGARAILMRVGEKDLLVAVTTRSGRFALDTELGKASFVPKTFTPDFAGVPVELPEALERELSALEARTVEIERKRVALKAELDSEWQSLAAAFTVAEAISDAKEGLDGSREALRLVGWMPKGRIAAVTQTLRKACDDRVAIRSFTPREVESVRQGKEDVPVLMNKRFFISNFERMVHSYGVPSYGSIDPTPFVATFFTILFSIMFGDVGQGGLIFIAGIALQFGWIKPLRKWKIFAPIVIAAGAGSMVMGILTGSIFSNEEWLIPLERVLTRFFTGEEKDRFLPLLQFLLKGDSTKILTFFGFTIALGVLINSLGLIFYMVNRIRSGKLGEAIFNKTGLCGALFLWWAIGMGVRLLMGAKLGWWDGLGLGIPVVLLIFEEQLAGLVDGHHHHNDDGAFANIIKGLVTVIETFSYYVSGTMSFLRVGAFALSHVVLSYIIFVMGDMVRESGGIGIVWEIVIVLIGNAIILVLEGMVVAIQVVRLQYYEFLSKFVTETGTLFAPFRFSLSKE